MKSGMFNIDLGFVWEGPEVILAKILVIRYK